MADFIINDFILHTVGRESNDFLLYDSVEDAKKDVWGNARLCFLFNSYHKRLNIYFYINNIKNLYDDCVLYDVSGNPYAIPAIFDIRLVIENMEMDFYIHATGKVTTANTVSNEHTVLDLHFKNCVILQDKIKDKKTVTFENCEGYI